MEASIWWLIFYWDRTSMIVGKVIFLIERKYSVFQHVSSMNGSLVKKTEQHIISFKRWINISISLILWIKFYTCQFYSECHKVYIIKMVWLSLLYPEKKLILTALLVDYKMYSVEEMHWWKLRPKYVFTCRS